MFTTFSWILLMLFTISRARADDGCLHPFSAQEIEECFGESIPFGFNPQGSELQSHHESATTPNPPHAAFPTSKPPHQGATPSPKPPPQNSSPPTTAAAATSTDTRASRGNSPTQQLSPASSGSRPQSDPSPSTASSVSTAMHTEFEMPTSASPSSSLPTPAIATQESPLVNGNGNGSHPDIGLIVGVLVPILTLLVMASILLYRRRARRTMANTISPLTIPPARREAAATRPYSSASDAYSFESSPARYSTEKRPHSLIFMPMMSYAGETDRETYDPPSTPRAPPPLHVNSDQFANIEFDDHDRDSRRVSERRIQSFISDRYGVLPSTGYGHSVGMDDQLPPYVRREGELNALRQDT